MLTVTSQQFLWEIWFDYSCLDIFVTVSCLVLDQQHTKISHNDLYIGAKTKLMPSNVNLGISDPSGGCSCTKYAEELLRVVSSWVLYLCRHMHPCPGFRGQRMSCKWEKTGHIFCRIPKCITLPPRNHRIIHGELGERHLLRHRPATVSLIPQN